MREQVDAILMASGFSKRFGDRDKLLQPFRGMPLAEHALSLLCGMEQIGRVHFVYSSEAVGRLAERYPANALYNANPQRGACESIRLGVSASGAGYYLFVPCDQPLLDAATIEAIICRRKAGSIVVPYSGGVPGSPALFSDAFREELLQLEDGETGRVVQKRNAKAVIPFEVGDAAFLEDIDTEDDLARLAGQTETREIVLTFANTNSAIQAEHVLLKAGIDVRVMSLPSAIRAGCGICLRLAPGDMRSAWPVLQQAGSEVEASYVRHVRGGSSEYTRDEAWHEQAGLNTI